MWATREGREKLIDQVWSMYGLSVSRMKLLAEGQNTTYQVDTAPAGSSGGLDKTRYVLKIHPPGKADIQEVWSELQWLVALNRDTDLLVPHPVPTAGGKMVGELPAMKNGKTCPCHLTRWVPGRQLAKGLRLLHFERLGKLMAGLHNHAETFQPPSGFVRPRWDAAMLERWMELIRQGEAADLIPSKYVPTFALATRRVKALMREMGEGRDIFGMIHADLGDSNCLFHGTQAGAIDFELCGFGYYLSDIAESLWGLQHMPEYPDIRQALIAGYRQVRPLPERQERCVAAFAGLSAVTTIGFLVRQERHDLSHLTAQFARHLEQAFSEEV